MSVSENQPDLCPHCQSSFEIVYVKFGFACTSLILSCPNCAMSSAREWRAESKALDRLKTLATNTRSFWQGVAGRMDALNLRFWYVLTFLIGARQPCCVTSFTPMAGSHAKEFARER